MKLKTFVGVIMQRFREKLEFCKVRDLRIHSDWLNMEQTLPRGQMHKILCRFTTKTLCTHKDKKYDIPFVRFIKLHVYLINLNHCGTGHMCTSPQLALSACRHLFRYQYLCLLYHSLDVSVSDKDREAGKLPFH